MNNTALFTALAFGATQAFEKGIDTSKIKKQRKALARELTIKNQLAKNNKGK